MKARIIETGEVGTASQFNMAGLAEVYFYGQEWMDTVYITDLEYYIEETKEWLSWQDARSRKLIAIDNHNQYFGKPNKRFLIY